MKTRKQHPPQRQSSSPQRKPDSLPPKLGSPLGRATSPRRGPSQPARPRTSPARGHSAPQRWPRPTIPLSIVVIGAGDIVRSAHLPAYEAAGLFVRGVFDVRRSAAVAVASAHDGVRVFATLAEAFAKTGAEERVVFDVAVPPAELAAIVQRAPRGAALLVQKPLGRDLAEANRIVRTATARRLVLAVNFQLRFSPALLVLRERIARGELGTVREVALRVVTDTPWQRWPFLQRGRRLELLYHSIHYLDLMRSLFGEPREVLASLRRDPATPDLADTRSFVELGYSHGLRVTILTNHAHRFGPERRESHLLLEGTRGAARVTLGVNLDYETRRPDTLEVSSRGSWRRVPLRGSWFPDAFAGPMSNLQRFVRGEDSLLLTRASDALRTMALVEACYRSSAAGEKTRP